MIRVLISTGKKLLLLRLKGVDEGLTSLYLHCLGIETMPVHRQHSPFKSILYEVAVSFLSSSLKRYTTLAGVELAQNKCKIKTQFKMSDSEIVYSRQTYA